MSDRVAYVEADGDVTVVSLELDVDFESEHPIVALVSSALAGERERRPRSCSLAATS